MTRSFSPFLTVKIFMDDLQFLLHYSSLSNANDQIYACLILSELRTFVEIVMKIALKSHSMVFILIFGPTQNYMHKETNVI